jgi:hypothetical protein
MAETPVPAKDPADAHMKRMLDAIKAKKYDEFVESPTPRFREQGRSAFGVAAAHYAPMLLKGYKTTYLGRIHKPERAISLWKLQPAGGGEDYLVRVVMMGELVDGFWIE